MRKIINYNGRALEITAKKFVYPFCYYEYKVYELVEKKHWWNFSRIQIISGSTFWWKEDDDFETKIMEKIEFHYNDHHTDNITKFFAK